MGFNTGSRSDKNSSIEKLIRYTPNSSMVDTMVNTVLVNNSEVKSNRLNAYDIVIQLDKIKDESVVVIKQLEHTNNAVKEAESSRVSNEIIRNDNELIRISNEEKRKTLFGEMNKLNISLNELKAATERAKDLANQEAVNANKAASSANEAASSANEAANNANNAARDVAKRNIAVDADNEGYIYIITAPITVMSGEIDEDGNVILIETV